jgi:hypothetical protein
MIDCEMLSTSCDIGDSLKIKVLNTGDNYASYDVSVTVSDAGYDLADNITLNSPPNVTSVFVDDSILLPENEIDLIPANISIVSCRAIIYEYDNETEIESARAEFFDNSSSFYGQADDNNYHYKNSSCFLNKSYGDVNEAEVNCTFNVWYYANFANWKCVVEVFDNLSLSENGSDYNFINSLLSIGIPDSPLDFGNIDSGKVSEEKILNITNYGNIGINLSIRGYALNDGDNLSMNCTLGSIKNISIEYEKYNLTTTNPGTLTLQEFESKYVNLSSDSKIRTFNLDYRKNEASNEAFNNTYWRIYVPARVSNCQGKVVIGAVRSAGN